MSLYHAYTVLDGVRQSLAECTELAAMVDRRELKAAGDIFHTHFRSFERVRHAVGHAGDKMKTPEKFAEHSFSGSYDTRAMKIENTKGLTITNQLEGRRFTNTWAGEIVSYEISSASLQRLEQAKQHLWAAFRKTDRNSQLTLARRRLVAALRHYAALSKT